MRHRLASLVLAFAFCATPPLNAQTLDPVGNWAGVVACGRKVHELRVDFSRDGSGLMSDWQVKEVSSRGGASYGPPSGRLAVSSFDDGKILQFKGPSGRGRYPHLWSAITLGRPATIAFAPDNPNTNDCSSLILSRDTALIKRILDAAIKANKGKKDRGVSIGQMLNQATPAVRAVNAHAETTFASALAQVASRSDLNESETRRYRKFLEPRAGASGEEAATSLAMARERDRREALDREFIDKIDRTIATPRTYVEDYIYLAQIDNRQDRDENAPLTQQASGISQAVRLQGENAVRQVFRSEFASVFLRELDKAAAGDGKKIRRLRDALGFAEPYLTAQGHASLASAFERKYDRLKAFEAPDGWPEDVAAQVAFIQTGDIGSLRHAEADMYMHILAYLRNYSDICLPGYRGSTRDVVGTYKEWEGFHQLYNFPVITRVDRYSEHEYVMYSVKSEYFPLAQRSDLKLAEQFSGVGGLFSLIRGDKNNAAREIAQQQRTRVEALGCRNTPSNAYEARMIAFARKAVSLERAGN